MAYPNPYIIAYSYTGFQQAQQGISAFPGTQLDNDLAGLSNSVAGLTTFVEQTLRSDGALNNGIVTFDSLSASLQTAGLAPATAWATATAYKIGNSVVINSSVYRALVSHTSGVFATDLAAGKWLLIATMPAGTNGTNGANGPVGASQPTGRLTLTSGVAVTTTDVAGQVFIYYTPVIGNQIQIWNGASFTLTTYAELTLPLDGASGHTGYHQSGKAYDLFVANDSGTVRLGTGPAWSLDTLRGTGAGTTELQLLNGFFVNKNVMTLRFGNAAGSTISVPANQATYVGTFYATADGQASDTVLKRLLWNTYNQSPRHVRVTDPAASWNYSATVMRQSNANVANQIDVLFGLAGGLVSLTATSVYSGVAADAPMVGIGLDSSIANAARSDFVVTANTSPLSLKAEYQGYPGLGRHTLRWLETHRSAPGATGTFYGTAGPWGTGLIGQLLS